MKTFKLTDTVRIARPDNLNWELQVHRGEAAPNVVAAAKARGAEVKPGWRTVGYYSTIAQAIEATLTKFPDLVVGDRTLEGLVDQLRRLSNTWMFRHHQELRGVCEPMSIVDVEAA